MCCVFKGRRAVNTPSTLVSAPEQLNYGVQLHLDSSRSSSCCSKGACFRMHVLFVGLSVCHQHQPHIQLGPARRTRHPRVCLSNAKRHPVHSAANISWWASHPKCCRLCHFATRCLHRSGCAHVFFCAPTEKWCFVRLGLLSVCDAPTTKGATSFARDAPCLCLLGCHRPFVIQNVIRNDRRNDKLAQYILVFHVLVDRRRTPPGIYFSL